jgi:hypothetical protein
MSRLWPYGEFRVAGFIGIEVVLGLCFFDLRLLSVLNSRILHNRCWPPSLRLYCRYQLFP